MPFISTIFGFLLIFSIYAATQFYRLNNFSLLNQVYDEQYAVMRDRIQEASIARAAKNYGMLASKDRETEEEVNNESDLEATLDKTRPPRLSRRLHLQPLVSLDPTQPQDAKYNANLAIFNHLITHLYANAPFFQEAKQARPGLQEDLVSAVLKKAFDLQIKQADQLANLVLDDEELQSVFLKMLLGNKKRKDQKDQNQDDVQDVAPNYEQNHEYPSLLDFLSFQGKAYAVCVYLVPPEVLYAVFQNDKTVSAIVNEREQIYKEVKEDKNKKQVLTQQFQSKFRDQVPANIDQNLIDFNVSGTKP